MGMNQSKLLEKSKLYNERKQDEKVEGFKLVLWANSKKSSAILEENTTWKD